MSPRALFLERINISLDISFLENIAGQTTLPHIYITEIDFDDIINMSKR